uniref:F-box domain-containing protein n=1 Tax=Panagrellus redivivus TaxID=6233 RepID=A0A7E4V9B9_PANRE
MTSSAIKRFTYDWLIRFMELTPEDANPNLGDISPLFNDCAKKYAPKFIFLKGDYYGNPSYTVPSHFKGKVVYTGDIPINSYQELAKLMRPNFHFHVTMTLWTEVDNIEFFDFKRVLGKSIKKRVAMDECQFASPVLFSELWPLVKDCEEVRLDVGNIHYEANMADMLADIGPCPRLEQVELHNLPASEAVVYPIVDLYLTTKSNRFVLTLFFNQDANVNVVKSMAAVIRQKINLLGYDFLLDSSSRTPSREIEFVCEKRV